MLGPSIPIHSNLPHDASSSEDEEDRLRREEEEELEQEHLLSRQFGEANEAPNSSSNKRSRQQTDAEIADALNSKSSSTTSDGTNKKKKKRLVLNETKLTGSKGLIFIRREFPSKLKYKDPTRSIMKKKPPRSASALKQKAFKREQFEMEINASASYLSDLMKAYQSFAVEIAPNMHHTDTFNKIQDLGGKKIVRDYLNTMREEVCKEHLNKIYGHERTEKLVHELEHGLNAHRERLLDDYNDIDNNLPLNNMRAGRSMGVLVENHNNNETSNEKDEDESRGENGDLSTKNLDHSTNNTKDDISNNNNDEEEEEMEATFDDVLGISDAPTAKENNSDKEDATEDISKDANETVNSKNVANEFLEESNVSYDGEDETDKEKSMIVEFSQSQESTTDEQLTVDASHIFEESQASVPSMAQTILTQMEEQEQPTVDASQNFEETQTVVPTMTPASQSETFGDLITQ
jgi:hypothetical protein